MKRTPVKSVLALVLAFMIAIGGITVNPISAQAAAKPTKITLSTKKQTVAVGKSFTLKVKSVTPKKADKGVKFKSSKTSVATVNSKGKVTGKKAGTAKITVTSKKNSKVKATCTVTVKPAVKIVTASNLVLQKGKSGTISVSVAPKKADKAVTFKTSNKKVATVDSKGKVKAKKAGTAKITVTAKDGSKKKTTATVKVLNKVTKTKKVRITNAPKAAVNIGWSSTLKTKVDSKAQNIVSWKSSNTDVVTVETNGKVKAVKAGKATITATAADGSKKKATCTITVAAPPAPTPTPDPAPTPGPDPTPEPQETTVDASAGSTTTEYIYTIAKGAKSYTYNDVAWDPEADMAALKTGYDSFAKSTKSLKENIETAITKVVALDAAKNEKVNVTEWKDDAATVTVGSKTYNLAVSSETVEEVEVAKVVVTGSTNVTIENIKAVVEDGKVTITGEQKKTADVTRKFVATLTPTSADIAKSGNSIVNCEITDSAYVVKINKTAWDNAVDEFGIARKLPTIKYVVAK